MRLTRRGYGVVGVGVVGFLAATLFGPRALNAVVLPAFVALVAGAIQLRSVDAPTVTRTVPPDGFPGETGTVRLTFDADDPFVGLVDDGHDDGVDAAPETVRTTVGGAPVEYEVTYRRRGERSFGPVELVARDVLGVVERELTVDERSTVLVYPAVRRLTPAAVGELGALYDTAVTNERDEFDTLREYERGDPLRDVHWKSTAKREEIIVKQFVAETDPEAVTIAGGAAAGTTAVGGSGGTGTGTDTDTGTGTGTGTDTDTGDEDGATPASPADEMAEAAASIALALLSAGVPVRVVTPDGDVTATPGGDARLLEHLARAGPGRVPIPEADVVIEATAAGTTVRIDDAEREFERMAGDRRTVDVEAGVAPDADEIDVDAGGVATGTSPAPRSGAAGADDHDDPDRDPGREVTA